MNKTSDTLIADIYNLVKTKEVDKDVDMEQALESFGENMKKIMRTELMTKRVPSEGLRLSAIGKTDRYLWNNSRNTKGEELTPNTLIKFMYGHLIEEMLILLMKASGHSVTDEQKVCHVEGVKGHLDCKVDGLLIDVKSTSTFGFKKFKDGSLAGDDPFGYIDQLKAYAHSEGTRDIGWLAMDKQNGHLALLKYNLDDKSNPYYDILNTDIAERVRHVKKMVRDETVPQQCHAEIPDGKSGNMKLATGCSYCQYKAHCFPDLRTFYYSYAPKFLTKVVNLPRVTEKDEF